MEVLEVGIPGFSPLAPPTRSAKAWPVDAPGDNHLATPDRVQIQSRFHGLLLGSLWEKGNPHLELNRSLFALYMKDRPSKAWPFSERAFAVASQSLLRDLQTTINDRGRASRFVSTSSMVDSFGITTWFEAESFRSMVAGTQKIMGAGAARCECWRIFLIKGREAIREAGSLASFYAVLEENRHLGLKVGVVLADAIPSCFSYESADFYCVLGRRVLITAPPYFFLAEFTTARPFDKEIVQAYSNLSDHLVESSRSDTGIAFEWHGGTLIDLETSLEGIAR